MRADPLTPHPSRLHPKHPDFAVLMEKHLAAIEEKADGYIETPTGNWVFTAQFHIDRGFCCESGCRHCPYLDE